MCVKIIKDNIECSYDIEKPFLEQLCGSTQIVVNYKPDDKEIESFLKGMQFCIDTGIDPKINVKVQYGDSIDGFKTNKKFIKAESDIRINEITKLMVLNQLETDKKLEEISSLCTKREIENV